MLETDLRELFKEDDEKNDAKTSPQDGDSESKKDPKPTREAQLVILCLQPAIRGGIQIFDLNGDGDFSDIVFRSIHWGESIDSRHKCVRSLSNKFFVAHDRHMIKRDSKRELVMQTKGNEPPSKRKKKKEDTSNNVKDRNAHRTQLLQLAMDWNCIDLTKELILKNSLDNTLVRYALFTNIRSVVICSNFTTKGSFS